MPSAKSIAEVVNSGLCIGCGLCESVTNGHARMTMTPYGSLRPTSVDTLDEAHEKLLLAACPGTVALARAKDVKFSDQVWGGFISMDYAWAKEPEIRFKAATGGALTALGMHLLKSGEAKFILHVTADPKQPMRSKWVISTSADEVLQRCGSRYGPVAPLAGLIEALDRGLPFGIIAKPCDLGAVHALSREDRRIDKLCVLRMAMVCGGQSRLKKSQELLDEFGVEEEELTTFRYRGYGNPGLTTLETRDGRLFHKTYQELWEDEGSWELETRCKMCPDALGEAADIVAADVWPGGGPTGEDEGFNGIITRSETGEAFVRSASEAGALTLGKAITPREFDHFQPHQVRKKHAVHARLSGMSEAGLPVLDTDGLRLEKLGENLSSSQRAEQIAGIKKRVADGRIMEPLPNSE